MDLTDPTRAITPTLDGPILAVLARTGRPLTVGEIAGEVSRGSEIGVRKALARLVDQGIVTATKMGRNVVHELNRDHIAAPAATVLASLRNELWKRLRETLADWEQKPTYACVFGSAARHDGGPQSDIDFLAVHPMMPGDVRSPIQEKSQLGLLGQVVIALASQPSLPPPVGDEQKWREQIDELRGKVQRWTGNSLQVVDISIWQWNGLAKTDPALYREISQDAVTVAGQRLGSPPKMQDS
jgi:predicted nucleotidyltransferase